MQAKDGSTATGAPRHRDGIHLDPELPRAQERRDGDHGLLAGDSTAYQPTFRTAMLKSAATSMAPPRNGRACIEHAGNALCE
jgi:hypothetical protein